MTGAPELVKAKLSELDSAYGVILSCLLRVVQSEPGKKYEKGTLKPLTSLPYLSARRKLEERFAAVISKENSWPNVLITTKETTLGGKYTIQDCSSLKTEATKRLQGSA